MARPNPPAKKVAAPLEQYQGRRDFKCTPEPQSGTGHHSGWSFVVQEHHARSHHFDFRLEMDGVLVSWAIPKGIPEDPAAKRLAVHVEDHPLEYGTFEGTIPKGNYGAGTVKIWDKGEWEPIDKDWRKAFGRGKIKFILKGERLHGEYGLFRMKQGANWIMRKLEEQASDNASPDAEREQARFIGPQLARLAPSVPSGSHWIHEIKFDGYRLIAVQRDGDVKLFTRNGLDWTYRFKLLAKKLAAVTPKDFVMDGEALVLDDHGRSCFGALQSALQSESSESIVFVAFDLLNFDGYNLRNHPLSDRLLRLSKLVSDKPGPVRRSTTWPSELGKELFKQTCSNGLEGIISKNLNGRYIEGSRRDWVKSKCRARQEFVICGYTPPKGSLAGFGALVLASFENGKLVPRGKVGTGFSDADRVRLMELFKPLRTSRAVLPSDDPDVEWLKPELVAEIGFSEITRDGAIRHGGFIGIREDKAAADVHLDGLQVTSADTKDAKVAGMVISHPDRLIYPAEQITKLEVARYYDRVGDLMLPFVTHRPLAVVRAPDGITGEMFFQKSFSNHLPPHVRQSQLDDGTTVFSVRDKCGLVALAQFGMVEVHPWGAPLPSAERPDFLTWDLDPDESVPWKEVLGAALLLRDFLVDKGLTTMVKTSGGKGLHLMLHLRRSHDWELMNTFARAVAAEVAALNPRRFTINSSKARRAGKIYIDWMRNGKGALSVAPWSLRARPGAPVSMPINWSQVPDVTAAGFTIHEPTKLPEEWRHLHPQIVRKSLLKEMGVLGVVR